MSEDTIVNEWSYYVGEAQGINNNGEITRFVLMRTLAEGCNPIQWNLGNEGSPFDSIEDLKQEAKHAALSYDCRAIAISTLKTTRVDKHQTTITTRTVVVEEEI